MLLNAIFADEESAQLEIVSGSDLPPTLISLPYHTERRISATSERIV